MSSQALPDPRPTSDKDAALVRRMFDRVAPRYDLANTVFSLGMDRHWRRMASAAADPRPGELLLDVASGTGALAADLAAAGASVVALDFSWNMLAAGRSSRGVADRRRRRSASHPDAGGADRPLPRAPVGSAAASVLWCNADGTRLPLPDATVDGVTIAFGLRNLPDATAGLREFARATRPGGRLVVLEFSTPTSAAFRRVYLRYVVAAIPRAARVISSDPAAYRYLADSIQAWPDQPALARVITAAGWQSVRWRNLTGGIVAVHHAIRP